MGLARLAIQQVAIIALRRRARSMPLKGSDLALRDIIRAAIIAYAMVRVSKPSIAMDLAPADIRQAVITAFKTSESIFYLDG
jgi:hypothetical protein